MGRAAYVRGVATSIDVAALRSIAKARGALIQDVHAECVRYQLEALDALSREHRTPAFYAPTVDLELIDVRPGDDLADQVRRSARRWGVSVRAWIYTAITDYCNAQRAREGNGAA